MRFFLLILAHADDIEVIFPCEDCAHVSLTSFEEQGHRFCEHFLKKRKTVQPSPKKTANTPRLPSTSGRGMKRKLDMTSDKEQSDAKLQQTIQVNITAKDINAADSAPGSSPGLSPKDKPLAIKGIKKEAEDFLPCPVGACAKTFSSTRLMKTHLSKAHIDVKLFTCEVCGDIFANEDDFGDHVDFHVTGNKKKIPCDHCDQYESDRRRDVRRHMLVCKFNPERKYKCKLCDAELDGKSKIMSHCKTIHKAKGGHFCIFCQKLFTSATGLTKHGCSSSKRPTGKAKSKLD